MIRFVNAKINLGLNILRKRQDGYHELETVFYPIGILNGTPANPESFGDILEIHPCDEKHEDEFTFTGNRIDCPLEKNLVYKAAAAFREKAKEKRCSVGGLKISLEKHIPDGAGLGGGSADAAMTMVVLNSLYDNIFSKEELIVIAAKLGADCPFFIENSPVIATGIGEIMQPVELDLSGWWAIVVKPSIYISTKEAFSGIKPEQPEQSLSFLISLPPEEWREAGLKNDFEPHIFSIYPQLKELKELLYENGAAFSAMTGSGSSIFGIFRREEVAREAFSRLRAAMGPECRVFLCKL